MKKEKLTAFGAKEIKYLTPPQMLAKAIEQYEEFVKIYDLKKNAEKTAIIAEEDKELFTQMMKNLNYAALLGEGDACFYLAHLHCNSWVEAQSFLYGNRDKGNFLIHVGQTLGSKKCSDITLDTLDNVQRDNSIDDYYNLITEYKTLYANKEINNNIKQEIIYGFSKVSLYYPFNVLFPTLKVSPLLSFDIKENSDDVNVSTILDSNISLMGKDSDIVNEPTNEPDSNNTGCLIA
ncbi:hypothetical protein [Rickettsia endosymbiont of Halotydeus destructor]|uniref:hypothetical protein n=1 Tax=Rickettsia endosymbiont of Halotydeus destructor TaxID=2996754 RepID=UPI003BB0B5EA